MKKILKYIIVFIIIIISFNILLLLTSLFPSHLIEQKVMKSSEILLKEGNLYNIKFLNYVFTINNNYSDSIMINACYSIDNKDPFFSYMSVRKNYKKDLTKEVLLDTKGELVSYSSNKEDEKYDPVIELKEFLDGKVTTSIEYARYWHGYIVFLRVLLLFLDIKQIRILLILTFIILLIIFSKLSWSKIGKINTLIIIFALIAYDYLFVGYSLESSPIFLTMMISSIILLKRIDKIKDIYLYFLIVGCISNFVDFLTVPTITLDMLLFIYILYNQKHNQINLKQSIRIIICSGMIWGVGYGLTWLTKWILYDFIYHKELISSAFSQVLYRASSTNELVEQCTIYNRLADFFGENMLNLRFFISVMLEVIAIMYIYRKSKYNFTFRIDRRFFEETIPIIMISLIPIVWYIVLSNHTILHRHFTYRHMIIVLIGELLIFKKTFIIKTKKYLNENKKH